MRRMDEELLRHAAADDAGAADLVLHGDGDPRPVSGAKARGADAAGAGADEVEVVVVLTESGTPPAAPLREDSRFRTRCPAWAWPPASTRSFRWVRGCF